MLERILRLSIAMFVFTGCAKNVPLNDQQDAQIIPANDPRCPSATDPVVDGQACTVNGLQCVYAASCGVDTTTCMDGFWTTIRCTPGRRCPCLTKSDCDVDASECVAGVYVQGTLPSCGGIGGACCGGFCGTCGTGAECVDSICVAATGTIGSSCTLQCDGTSNCDLGEYCPDSCVTCPCTDTCHAQGSICTLGADQTCNGNPTINAILGHCIASQGPYATTCTCDAGYLQDPVTGKCS